MFYEVKTQAGTITLDKAVVGSLINREIAAFQGRVLPCSPKGRPFKIAGKTHANDDGGSFFDFLWNDDGSLDLRIFVVIRMGSSISAVTAELIALLREGIERATGFRVRGVSVAVKGILARNLSRRDIEVKG